MHGNCGDTVSLATSDELVVSADTSDKVHPVVTLDVCDAEYLFENVFIDDLCVKLGDWRAVVNFLWLYRHDMPSVIYVETVGMFGFDFSCFSIGKRTNVEISFESCQELLL